MNLLEQKKLELELAEKLQQLGLLKKAHSIDGEVDGNITVVFFTDGLDSSMSILHVLAQEIGHYILSNYDCSASDGATYAYDFDNISVRFFSSDLNRVIETLGQGKCKIVEETSKPETVKRVVCAL